MRKSVVAFICFAMCLACSPKRAVVRESVTTKVTETLHDTIFKTLPDSSDYAAVLECKGDTVFIREIVRAKPGKYLAPPKARIQDNVLQVDCEARAQELLAQWKSKQTVTVVEVPVLTERSLTVFEQVQIWLGRLMMLIFLGLLITVAIQIKNWLSGRKH